MRYFTIFLAFYSVYASSCSDSSDSMQAINCIASEFDEDISYNDLISEIPPDVITALVERPDERGALGRNKNGYFHVRFQLNMTRLSDHAVKFQSEESLSEYLRNLNYAFSYQNPEGDFQFIAPDALQQSSDYQAPNQADLASGTAFFAYSLGMSLHSLSQSDWYMSASSSNSKNAIDNLSPNIRNMLAYLKRSVDLLYGVDANAPNRLLFNALAFYSLGTYLDDQAAKSIGIGFANEALAQRNEVQGYFIEGGGWDSSYNGVAIKLGFELFTLIMNDSGQPIKSELAQGISCATDWQKSRILPTGEISTEGNSRVFPGGEVFLGNEKEVDVLKTVKAFFYMSTLSNDNGYEELAQRVIEYYE